MGHLYTIPSHYSYGFVVSTNLIVQKTIIIGFKFKNFSSLLFLFELLITFKLQ